MTICVNYIFQHFHQCFCEDILCLEHHNWTIPGSSSVLKLKGDKRELNLKPIQSAPPMDEYITGFQTRPTLILDDNSPLLTSLMTVEPTSKAVLEPPKLPKPTEDNASDFDENTIICANQWKIGRLMIFMKHKEIYKVP